MAKASEWAKRNELARLIGEALDEWYGDAEDWQPAYLGISPDLDEVVCHDDIRMIPAGWHIEDPCMFESPEEEIADMYFDLR